MGEPYSISIREMFDTPDGYSPLICPDPENCMEMHNEEEPGGEDGAHHYGCECGWCMYIYWTLKH